MDDIREQLKSEFRDHESRHDYADEFLNSYIALQIKTLRQQRGWSQKELADLAEMKQSRVSAMEQVDYESWTIQTLQRLARAFDLALVVRLESFGAFLEEMTRLSRGSLERPSFDDDPAFKASRTATSDGDSMAVATFKGKQVRPPRMSWRLANG